MSDTGATIPVTGQPLAQVTTEDAVQLGAIMRRIFKTGDFYELRPDGIDGTGTELRLDVWVSLTPEEVEVVQRLTGMTVNRHVCPECRGIGSHKLDCTKRGVTS